ncbi:unnamed protein product [Brassica oleracea]
MEGEKSSGGGKKAGIAFGVIAAARYMLKKRRDNIRRSRYEYAATEFF